MSSPKQGCVEKHGGFLFQLTQGFIPTLHTYGRRRSVNSSLNTVVTRNYYFFYVVEKKCKACDEFPSETYDTKNMIESYSREMKVISNTSNSDVFITAASIVERPCSNIQLVVGFILALLDFLPPWNMYMAAVLWNILQHGAKHQANKYMFLFRPELWVTSVFCLLVFFLFERNTFW